MFLRRGEQEGKIVTKSREQGAGSRWVEEEAHPNNCIEYSEGWIGVFEASHKSPLASFSAE
jgi:hypothetical protein